MIIGVPQANTYRFGPAFNLNHLSAALSLRGLIRMRTVLTLAAVGVTGGNLKRRIEQIMNARDVPGLSFAKKAALTIAGAAVLMAPVLVGIANAQAMLAQYASGDTQWEAAAGGHMAFDVASVKALKPGSRGRAPNLALDN